MMKTKIVSALALVVLTGCGINKPASGDKIGQIVKISKGGIFCDTWEAQLIRGGMNNGSGSFGTQPFDFTVESDKDAEYVKSLMESQTEVKLHYRNEGIYSSFRSDSDGHFMVNIEPIKKDK